MAKWEITEANKRSPSDMVREFLSVTGQTPDPILYETLIEEEFFEWQNELPKTFGDLKELADLVYVIYGYAIAQGLDLDEALVRVHQNNIGRCIHPDGTVQRREDGKIIKNPDYPKVQLEDLIS
jgi:hypothetical protein